MSASARNSFSLREGWARHNGRMDCVVAIASRNEENKGKGGIQ
jgi:hypothetical protein